MHEHEGASHACMRAQRARACLIEVRTNERYQCNTHVRAHQRARHEHTHRPRSTQVNERHAHANARTSTRMAHAASRARTSVRARWRDIHACAYQRSTHTHASALEHASAALNHYAHVGAAHTRTSTASHVLARARWRDTRTSSSSANVQARRCGMHLRTRQ